MRWRKVAFWAGFGLLLVPATLLLALWTVDLGVLKPHIERWVSDATGREFAVDGQLSIDVGGESVIVARDVRFANAGWADDPHMLSIGYVEVRVTTKSLFRGPARVQLVDIRNADVRLQRDDAGQTNWTLAQAVRRDADEPPARADGPDVLFRHVVIDDAHLVYASPEREGPLDLRIERFDQAQREDGYLQLDVRGGVGGRDVTARGKVGTWSALLAQQDVEFELDAQIDKLTITGRGRIDDLAAPSRPQLSFSAQAPDINELMRALQLPAGAVGDIDLEGSVSSRDAGPLALVVRGNLGQMNIEANASALDLQSLEQVDLHLVASAPDLGRILRLFGVHRVGEAPFDVALNLRRRGPMVVVDQGKLVFAGARIDLDAQLPGFPSPEGGSARLRIAGTEFAQLRDTLQLPGRAEGAYSMTVELAEAANGVEVVQLDVESQLLRATGNATLGPAPDYVGSELAFNLDTPSLARLGRVYGIANLPAQAVTIDGAAGIVAQGVRTRGPVAVRSGEFLANLDGLITLRPGLKGSALTATMRGPDLALLIGEFVTVDAVPSQPYDLTGRVSIEKTSYLIKELAGTIGSTSVALDGRVASGEGLAGTRVDFRAFGPALEELTAGIAGLAVKAGRFDLAGELALGDDRINLENVRLSRELGEAELDLALAVPLSTREAAFDVRARGDDVRAFVGEPLGFKASAAPFSIAARGELAGTRASIDELAIEIGEATLTADGNLDFADARRSTRFRASFNAPQLGQLGLVNGRRLREQSLSVEATVEGDASTLTIDDLVARIGESDLHASVRLEKGAIPRLEIDAQSDSLVLVPFLEEGGFEYDPQPRSKGERLLSDVAIPLARLRALNASVNVDIAELQRGPIVLRDVALASTLKDGTLSLDHLGFNAPSGWFRARGSVQPVDESARLQVEMAARDLALGLPGVNANLVARTNVDISMEATGASLRQLASTANGVVYVDMREARVAENRLFRKLYGDMLNEMLSTVSPFSKSDRTVMLECVVAPLKIEDGRLSTQPAIVLMSDRVRMLTNARVDLATEELDAQIRSTPRKGLTLSAGEILNPYIRIGGTLAEPQLGLDEKGVLVSGGAAVLTGGLSVLARTAWDRVSRSREPCQEAAAGAVELLGEHFPVFTSTTTQ